MCRSSCKNVWGSKLRQHTDILRQEQQLAGELRQRLYNIRHFSMPGGERSYSDAYRRIRDLCEYFQNMENTVEHLCDATAHVQKEIGEKLETHITDTKRLFL